MDPLSSNEQTAEVAETHRNGRLDKAQIHGIEPAEVWEDRPELRSADPEATVERGRVLHAGYLERS